MSAALRPAVRRRIASLGLAVLAAAYLGTASRLLVYDDLSLDYPFRGADDLDWISNALALGGDDVRYTGRLPLFPLVLLGLELLGRLPWSPVVQQATLLALAAFAYLLARLRASPPAATAVALGLGLSHPVQALALGVSADLLAATLLAAATWLFLAARGRPACLVAAGATAGLSALTQGAAHLWLGVAVAVAALDRESRAARGWLVAAAGLYALPSLAWAAAGPPGSGADSIVLHRELVAPSLDHLGFYARATFAFLGLPGLLLAVAGLAAAWRARDATAVRFAVTWTAVVAAFFGVAYGFAADRFLIYAVPGLALVLAEGLRRFADRPAVLATLSLALVAGAAWPWGEGWRAWTPVRVLAAHRQATPQPTLAPERLAGVDGVVYLAGDGEGAESRYLHQYRLGNVLRRRVRVASAALYPAAWWAGGGFTRLGSVGTTAVYRGRWAGGPAFALATEDSGVLAALAGAPAPDPAIPPEAWTTARAVAALAPAPDGLLLALGEPRRDGDWLRALPLVASTTSVFVPTGPDLETALAMARGAACSAPRLVDGVRVCRMTLGWEVAVAFAPSLSPPPA